MRGVCHFVLCLVMFPVFCYVENVIIVFCDIVLVLEYCLFRV